MTWLNARKFQTCIKNLANLAETYKAKHKHLSASNYNHDLWGKKWCHEHDILTDWLLFVWTSSDFLFLNKKLPLLTILWLSCTESSESALSKVDKHHCFWLQIVSAECAVRSNIVWCCVVLRRACAAFACWFAHALETSIWVLNFRTWKHVYLKVLSFPSSV